MTENLVEEQKVDMKSLMSMVNSIFLTAEVKINSIARRHVFYLERGKKFDSLLEFLQPTNFCYFSFMPFGMTR